MSERLKVGLVSLLLCIGVWGCGTSGAVVPKPSIATPAAQTAAAVQPLTVGLYPWVPRPGQLQQAISAAWSSVHPDVALSFKSLWDGGYSGDPSGMDVFVFDAIFLDYFRDQNYLTGLTAAKVSELDDYIAYAINGAKSGELYYGLPMFGCANILFYRQGDQPVAQASTLSALTDALGKCTYTSQVPPDQRGLLVDLAGGTTNSCMYVDLVESIHGQWPVVLPTDPSELNPTAIGNARALLASASMYNATQDPPNGAYGRAAWFSQGNGRALMAFTEAMSAMSAQTRAALQFKPFPLGDDPSAKPLFYSDMVGVSPSSRYPQLAIELANLMASTKVMVAGMQGSASEPPQFLMPVRTSIFTELAQQDALYTRMQTMVASADPILFNLGVNARVFISGLKDAIKQQTRASYACGCDEDGGRLSDQSQANTVCPTVCRPYGGWNGQWTDYPPGGTDTWQSGCGCNTCPR